MPAQPNLHLNPATHTHMTAYTDDYFEFRINRKLLAAIFISLLIHSLLFVYIRPDTQVNNQPVNAPDNVLSVQLNPLAQEPSPVQQPARQKARIKAPLKHVPQPPTPHLNTQIVAAAPPKQISMPLPAPITFPDSVPTDMTSYINAVRAQRQLAERGESAAPQPSEEDIRNANIRRNLQLPGGGGIFQITRVGTRSANFTFRGWDSAYSNGRRENIEVESDSSSNLELAIIRKMIVIIRQRHKADFNWESQRLNRVISLSARISDNAGLEDFLMREFFKAGLRPSEQ